MTTVSVYYHESNRRSVIIANAMAKGIAKTGDRVRLVNSREHPGVTSDVYVGYGWGGGMRFIWEQYKAAGRPAVYIDLGYWGRRNRTKHDGCHKIVVNSRHPNDYFQRVKHPSDRFKQLGLVVKPWRRSAATDRVLLIGMSGKAAQAEGLHPERWERETAALLRRKTDRVVVYRPKPNWSRARPIPGTAHQGNVPVETALADGVHAVVSHHSNICVDAVLSGIPAFCVDGVALPMSLTDMTRVDDPWYPDEREQWAWDIAYTQWNIDEMMLGLPWRHMKSEGLVP